jgi:hypothetical protein
MVWPSLPSSYHRTKAGVDRLKRAFTVKAVWDAEAEVYVSESDIIGLHIETQTLDEFEEVMNDVAAELVFANHISAADMASVPLRDIMPAIIWLRPDLAANAA